MTAERVLALRKETVFHSGVSDGHPVRPTDPTASLSLPYNCTPRCPRCEPASECSYETTEAARMRQSGVSIARAPTSNSGSARSDCD